MQKSSTFLKHSTFIQQFNIILLSKSQNVTIKTGFLLDLIEVDLLVPEDSALHLHPAVALEQLDALSDEEDLHQVKKLIWA